MKGRRGEFDALAKLAEPTVSGFTPLLEVVPPDDPEDVSSIKLGVKNFADRLASAWSGEKRAFVDAGLLDLETDLSAGKGVQEYLFDELRVRRLSALPVVRLSDSTRVVEEVRGAVEKDGRGACLRLSGEDFDEDPDDLKDQIEKILARLSVVPSDVDLILDFGSISTETSVALAGRVAVLALRNLPCSSEWRSLTVAAGAFPADLGSFQAWALGEIPRLDAELWRRIAHRRGLPRTPGFGDYATSHPLVSTGVVFNPPPQLSYTVADRWLVLKGGRRDPRGSRQFYDICRNVAVHAEFATAALGWGDTHIEKAAQSPPSVGPGNGTMWRAVGTAHHIDLVVARLTGLGDP
jgi:hypothetical protein